MTSPINGIYVLQSVVPAQIAAAPAGVKVVETTDDAGQLFSPAQVAEMASGGGTVLGYFSVGEAESYRPYFASLPASSIGPTDPAFAGDFEVAYWTPAWAKVATDAVSSMASQGFHGIYLDVVGEAETAWAKANAPGGDAIGAMVSLVQSISAYAHSISPGFKVWINASGAEDLLANPAFVKAIDGAFEEELFFKDGGAPQAPADVAYNLGFLQNVVAAGKPVVAIEYVSGAAKVDAVHAQAAAAGIGSYVANPNLGLVGVDPAGLIAGSSPVSGAPAVPGPAPTPPGPTPAPSPSPAPGPIATNGPSSAPTPAPPSSTPPSHGPVPQSTGIHADVGGADLGAGASVVLSVGFDRAVVAAGAPQLTLSDGGMATYVSGSGTDTLRFAYQVQPGENAGRLAVTGLATSASATLSGVDGAAASIGAAIPEAIVVDTTRDRTDVGIGHGDRVRVGDGGVVTLSGGNARFIFQGGSDVAFLGDGSQSVNAVIRDQSSGLTVDVVSGGHDVFRGFANDPTAVIHLFGGLGGYATPKDVIAALVDDGNGGTSLSLGSGYSIDFVNADLSAFHQANFRVG